MTKVISILFLFLTQVSLRLSAQNSEPKFNPDCAKVGQKIPNCNYEYVDFEKYWRLNDENIPQLDSLAKLFISHISWNIEIANYTDCRSSFAYNDTLSQKRAETIKKYLIYRGVPSQNLFAKGYGERKLLNNCGCEDGKGPGMDCTEEEHQINRRTEFVILENSEKCK